MMKHIIKRAQRVEFYKNIFVSHDMINQYVAMTAAITGAGCFCIHQSIKDLEGELKGNMKDLKDLIIANNQQRK